MNNDPHSLREHLKISETNIDELQKEIQNIRIEFKKTRG